MSEIIPPKNFEDIYDRKKSCQTPWAQLFLFAKCLYGRRTNFQENAGSCSKKHKPRLENENKK